MLLGYVEKLTRTPADMTRDDLDELRAVGFADADLLAICEVTAYYAYVNRIADGLGVDLEPDLAADEPPDSPNPSGGTT